MQYNTMATASLAPQTTSNGSIATDCTIPIVSTVVTPNLITTRVSHCLFHLRSLTLQMISKFSCSYEFHVLTVLPCTHIYPLSPSSSTHSHWLSTIRGGVESLPTPRIRQGNLTALPHFLDNARNTKMLYPVLTPRPHVFEQV